MYLIKTMALELMKTLVAETFYYLPSFFIHYYILDDLLTTLFDKFACQYTIRSFPRAWHSQQTEASMASYKLDVKLLRVLASVVCDNREVKLNVKCYKSLCSPQ